MADGYTQATGALADANSAEGLRLLEVPIIAETRALG